MPGTGGGGTSPELRVVAGAFDECAHTLTTRGMAIAALAGQLTGACSGLGEPAVGGHDAGSLAVAAAGLSRALASIGGVRCPGAVRALQAIRERFQEVDAGQATACP
jgi:hypothetical protein